MLVAQRSPKYSIERKVPDDSERFEVETGAKVAFAGNDCFEVDVYAAAIEVVGSTRSESDSVTRMHSQMTHSPSSWHLARAFSSCFGSNSFRPIFVSASPVGGAGAFEIEPSNRGFFASISMLPECA